MASLGALDLDPGLDPDLDPDPAFEVDSPAPITTPTPTANVRIPNPILSAPALLQSVGGLTLDPTLPLFFPQPDNAKMLYCICTCICAHLSVRG
jgi:hypothetical protein